MKDASPSLLIVSADAGLVRQTLRAIFHNGHGASVPVAANLRQARARLRKAKPAVVLLDEAVLRNRPVGPAVREFACVARVVCLMSPSRQAEASEIEELIHEGKAVVVWREGRFLSHLADVLGRDLGAKSGTPSSGVAEFTGAPEGFGEILRHEVNNPLTGILGNAELLLARRDSFPPAAVQRLETIAELAIRLRETIRRLSEQAETRHARSA
jgi:signal transduction histidine kinase